MCFVSEDEGPRSCHICDPDAYFFLPETAVIFPDWDHLLYHIYVKHPDYALKLNDGSAELCLQVKTNLAARLNM